MTAAMAMASCVDSDVDVDGSRRGNERKLTKSARGRLAGHCIEKSELVELCQRSGVDLAAASAAYEHTLVRRVQSPIPFMPSEQTVSRLACAVLGVRFRLGPL
eukprot:2025097-Rhodomonas_salina.1